MKASNFTAANAALFYDPTHAVSFSSLGLHPEEFIIRNNFELRTIHAKMEPINVL